MNGKGRAIDDVFIERLWRSLKYEEVYLHDYSSGIEANVASRKNFQFYDHKRAHSALDGETLATVSLGHDWSLPKLIIKYRNSTPPFKKGTHIQGQFMSYVQGQLHPKLKGKRFRDTRTRLADPVVEVEQDNPGSTYRLISA